MDERCYIPDRSGRDLLFTPDFTADELTRRRHGIAAKIGRGAHLLVAAAPPVPTDHPVQDANYYYFTGLETCHSWLLVEGGSGRSIVFLPSRDAMAGEPAHRLGFEDADLIRARTGVDDVLATPRLADELANVRVLHLPMAEVEGGGASRWSANACARRRAEQEWDRAEPGHQRLARLLRERWPSLVIEDACPLISAMRTIKSRAEIAVLRQAGALAAEAIMAAMAVCRPGVVENRLQAAAEYVFRDRGHCGPAYATIVAGGRRTWDGHYRANNATLGADEIVLMDCGPDLRHYASDIARLWPVNGVFAPWHRRVYGFIVAYHKTLLSLIRPGAMPADIDRETRRQMAMLCDKPDAPYHDLKPLFEQMVRRGVRYLNHAVGLSAHDAVGPWRDQPLSEGFVGVVDPMVWCEPEHEYIRVEDTFVVTADGCERLTGAAPIEIEPIEALLRDGRAPAARSRDRAW